MTNEIPLPKVTSLMAEKSEMDRHRELEEEVGIQRAFNMVRIAETVGYGENSRRYTLIPLDNRPHRVRLTEHFKQEGYSDKAIELWFAL